MTRKDTLGPGDSDNFDDDDFEFEDGDEEAETPEEILNEVWHQLFEENGVDETAVDVFVVVDFLSAGLSGAEILELVSDRANDAEWAELEPVFKRVIARREAYVDYQPAMKERIALALTAAMQQLIADEIIKAKNLIKNGHTTDEELADDIEYHVWEVLMSTFDDDWISQEAKQQQKKKRRSE